MFHQNSGWGTCSSVEGTKASCEVFVKLCQVSSDKEFNGLKTQR